MPVSTTPLESIKLPLSPPPYRSPPLVLEHSSEEDYTSFSSSTRMIIDQNPVSITLDGSAICVLALGLVLLLHFVDLWIVKVLVSLVPVGLLVDNDYRNFLNLGPGGTPSTFRGYLRICRLRLISLRDPFKPLKADPNSFPREGILARKAALPYRSGPRPMVAGIAPQRQLNQHGSEECFMALRRAMKNLGQENPSKFATERSFLEKHGLALFARNPLKAECQGEICHVHDADHSLHMCLHPEDSKEILQKGWGQRHPLAREGAFPKMPVPQDFVLIYAPRNEQELQIVSRIISAAVWYTIAEEVELTLS